MQTSVITVAGQRYSVPTEMHNAVIGDAIAAGFVNETAAESLSYELREWETGEYANGLDLDEWVRYLEVAEVIR